MKAPKWYRKLEQWVEGDARDLKEPKAHDESITEETMLNSVRSYGYESLEEAENKA